MFFCQYVIKRKSVYSLVKNQHFIHVFIYNLRYTVEYVVGYDMVMHYQSTR